MQKRCRPFFIANAPEIRLRFNDSVTYLSMTLAGFGGVLLHTIDCPWDLKIRPPFNLCTSRRHTHDVCGQPRRVVGLPLRLQRQQAGCYFQTALYFDGLVPNCGYAAVTPRYLAPSCLFVHFFFVSSANSWGNAQFLSPVMKQYFRVPRLCLFFVCGWAHSKPMREDVT